MMKKLRFAISFSFPSFLLSNGFSSFFPKDYRCEKCKETVVAIRTPTLVKVPPFLNFQFMRFVFDMGSLDKKKLMDAVEFPTRFDMGAYVQVGFLVSFGLFCFSYPPFLFLL